MHWWIRSAVGDAGFEPVSSFVSAQPSGPLASTRAPWGVPESTLAVGPTSMGWAGWTLVPSTRRAFSALGSGSERLLPLVGAPRVTAIDRCEPDLRARSGHDLAAASSGNRRPTVQHLGARRRASGASSPTSSAGPREYPRWTVDDRSWVVRIVQGHHGGHAT